MAGIEARFHLDWPGFKLDVELKLPARGFTVLFGPSGSGKTTLLRCIAGLERAPRGQLVVNGAVWQDTARWLPTHQRPIGYVFQEASLFAHLSVLGNLRYGVRRTPQVPRVSLEHVIELLGIGHLLQRKPEGLSGGERQRVSIARALVVSPELLLMDEPLAALDHQRKREILPYLERLHEQLDIPVLYVSHAADEVARLADHLVVLDHGSVRASGPLTQVLAQIDLPIRLGEDALTVHAAQIGAVDTQWQLARLDFAGLSLWTPDPGLPVGQHVRVRVLARDVSLALEPARSSIQNVLLGRVEAIGADLHPGLILVRVQVGTALLLARLTRKAAAGLGVVIGQPIWVQVKSVALLD